MGKTAQKKKNQGVREDAEKIAKATVIIRERESDDENNGRFSIIFSFHQSCCCPAFTLFQVLENERGGITHNAARTSPFE